MDNIIRVKQKTMPEEKFTEPADKKSLLRFLRILIIFILVLAISWSIFSFIQNQKTWRAVFLTNNQVYFGHFSYIPFLPTITLKDIYYLQVSQPIQPQTPEQVQPEIKIVKFGKEIHGPKDKMVIPKSQILFWEDLRDDSPVAKAIQEYKAK